LLERDGRYDKVVECWVKDPDLEVAEVFEGLQRVQKGVHVEVLPRLLELSITRTAQLVKDLPLHAAAIDILRPNEHRLLAYLRCLLQPDEGKSVKLDLPSRHLFVSLLSRLDPSAAIPYLDSTPKGYFDLALLVNESEERGWHEGQLWALNQDGRTEEAMGVVGDLVRQQGTALAKGLLSGEDGDTHLAMEEIHTVVKLGVGFCVQHNNEEMWFNLLNEMIDLSGSISTLSDARSLQPIIQETLQSLLASSVSFPKLFKRLVGSGTKGRAYSEFREILGGMLESFRAESEILEVTVRLVRGDLFEEVERLVKGREQGWRGQDGCQLCEGKVEDGWLVFCDGRVVRRSRSTDVEDMELPVRI
jgi:hypothetical protein